jgi:hypothetical protein
MLQYALHVWDRQFRGYLHQGPSALSCRDFSTQHRRVHIAAECLAAEEVVSQNLCPGKVLPQSHQRRQHKGLHCNETPHSLFHMLPQCL